MTLGELHGLLRTTTSSDERRKYIKEYQLSVQQELTKAPKGARMIGGNIVVFEDFNPSKIEKTDEIL